MGETGSSRENEEDKRSITDGFKTKTERTKSNRTMSNAASYVTDQRNRTERSWGNKKG